MLVPPLNGASVWLNCYVDCAMPEQVSLPAVHRDTPGHDRQRLLHHREPRAEPRPGLPPTGHTGAHREPGHGLFRRHLGQRRRRPLPLGHCPAVRQVPGGDARHARRGIPSWVPEFDGGPTVTRSGYGWFIEPAQHEYHDTGGRPGDLSENILLPRSRSVVIVLSNLDTSTPDDIAEHLAKRAGLTVIT